MVKNILILDTETSNLKIFPVQIFQISWMIISDEIIKSDFKILDAKSFFRKDLNWSSFSFAEIHTHKSRQLKNEIKNGIDLKEIISILNKDIIEYKIKTIAGHNIAAFDLQHLYKNCKNIINLDFFNPEKLIYDKKKGYIKYKDSIKNNGFEIIDTMLDYKIFLPLLSSESNKKQYSLEKLYNYFFKKDPLNNHEAFMDVYIVFKLLPELEKMKKQNSLEKFFFNKNQNNEINLKKICLEADEIENENWKIIIINNKKMVINKIENCLHSLIIDENNDECLGDLFLIN
jgi:DNA polymerase elongation subunit (family B)